MWKYSRRRSHWPLAALLAWLVLCSTAVGVYAAEADNEVHSVVSCTSSTGELLAANRGRVSALFVNDGTAPVYLKVNEAAVASEGIRLNANGGSYYISDKEGNLDLEAVNCITASATIVVMVTEWSN